jgi:predicted TIM-barrel fold metal-dependent hydrolase
MRAGAVPALTAAREAPPAGPAIVDTNVHLFDWPFRKLKYGGTRALVEKLRTHRIGQAWAGSFESLFHKDIDGVNARLAEECRTHGDGMLIPFGTVNLAWGDWEEDLRRCHENYRMPGIRIYPGYQTFDTDHPEFARFMSRAAARGMIVQIAGDMEDTRTHHPILRVGGMKAEVLIDVVKTIPGATVQLVYWNHQVTGKTLTKLIDETNITLDTSRLEGTGAIGRLIEGKPWTGSAKPVPVERLVFGSHAPYFPVEANLLKLFESPLILSQMKSIMSDNARRLLKTS